MPDRADLSEQPPERPPREEEVEWTQCTRCGATLPDEPIRRAHHLLNHGQITMAEFEQIAETERAAAVPSPREGADPADPRTFVLVRHEDETGVSTEQGAAPGERVAWGCAFPDGPTVIRWCVSDVRQTAVFASLDDVLAIHGHGGKTEVVWLQLALPDHCGATDDGAHDWRFTCPACGLEVRDDEASR